MVRLTLPRTRRRRWSRRRITAAVALLLGGVVVVWLLDHLRPRHAHFQERVGSITTVEEGEVEFTAAGYRHQFVQVRATTGLEVRFRILRPAAESGRIPLVILLAGHRTGSRAIELIGDPGAIAVVALDYPYYGPEKIRGIWQGVRALPQIQRALLDTPPSVTLALDWLITQPWVETERVELAGVSLGTPFAAVAGNLDSRFRRVWFLHGGADNRVWLNTTLRERLPNDVLRGLAASSIHLLAHGASFNTATWVEGIGPRPVVVIGADSDESLSQDDVRQLYEAAREPRELFWTSGGHVTSHRVEIVRALLDIVRGRLAIDDGAR